MELNEFVKELEKSLRNVRFVEDWSIVRTNTTLNIKVILKRKSILKVFYNKLRRIQSFALIINEQRIWGLDKDNRLGWHEHPLRNPETHETIESHSIQQIIEKLERIWNQIFPL
jgi:hypothetical protein